MDLSELKTNRVMQAIVALFSVVVMILVCIVLMVQTLPPLKVQQAELDATLQDNDQRLNRIMVMAANEANTRATYEALKAALPADVNQNNIFDTLQLLSQKHHIKNMEKISFGENKPVGDVVGIPVSISCIGGYDNVMALLEDYTGSGRLTQLTNLSIRAEGAASGAVRVDAELVAYYYPGLAGVVAVAVQ